jgi:uncharacterized RDD family membrane protein YckC
VTATSARATAAPAPWGRRLGGWLLDAAPVLALLVLGWVLLSLGLLAGGGDGAGGGGLLVGAGVLLLVAGPVLALGWWLYLCWQLGSRGDTPGKRRTGVRVLGQGDARPIGWGRAVGRSLLLAVVGVITSGIGLLVLLALAARDPLRRGWHDLAVGSVVVDTRPPTPTPTATSAAPATAAATPSPIKDMVTAVPGAAPATWTAELDDGRTIALSELVLLGRDPAAADGEDGAQLVAVDDAARSVSKTHLAVGVDARGPWACDRWSTNGSALLGLAGAENTLPPGERVHVGDGAVVRFGDRRLTLHRT